MSEFIKIILGRLVGAGVGAAAAFGASKGLDVVDPNCQAAVTNAVVGGAMLAGYGIAHKLTNRKVNPKDTAK